MERKDEKIRKKVTHDARYKNINVEVEVTILSSLSNFDFLYFCELNYLNIQNIGNRT